MEAFSLLKYWKASGGSGGPPHTSLSTAPKPTTTTTIVAAVSDHHSDAADDDGPFFDLEFAVPPEEEEEEGDDDEDGTEGGEKEETEAEIDEDEEVVEESELEPNLTFSPSDALFFKGQIVRIDGSEDVINSGNKSGQFPIPVSLARSATKFRVFLLGLKRSKSGSKQCPPPQNQPNNKKFFTVKFKVEEVPIFSLLTRATSNSKVNSNTPTPTATSTANDDGEEEQQHKKCDSNCNLEGCGDEKKKKKEVVQKYLKMVKPLYIKVSKNNQKGRAEKEKREKMGQKQGLNLKVMMAKKHLGKSKSAVVHSMIHNSNTTSSLSSSSSSNKRDDSLFQQQDGIQSAILHCKRSFNSSKDGQAASSVLLTQLVAESLNEKKTTTEAAAEEVGNGVVAGA